METEGSLERSRGPKNKFASKDTCHIHAVPAVCSMKFLVLGQTARLETIQAFCEAALCRLILQTSKKSILRLLSSLSTKCTCSYPLYEEINSSAPQRVAKFPRFKTYFA